MATVPLPNGPDPSGLSEFSVVYTDRTLNHMSKKFQGVMKDLNETFCTVYSGDSLVIIPGSGSYGMEAVARQFIGKDDKAMVIRNGFFSFRWTQIFDTRYSACPGMKEKQVAEVFKAQPSAAGKSEGFRPAPIEDVVKAINENKPAVVFAPHVETSAGIILPNDYIKAVGDAVRANGGLFVLDCIASGCIWVNMKELSIDIVLTAPQKGWSAMACSGLVVMGQRSIDKLQTTTSDSFCLNLKQWHTIMQAYLNPGGGPGHAYHCTMPTDALLSLHATKDEMSAIGYEKLRDLQQELGDKVREALKNHGFKSVAAEGFGAPGVVVCYTDDAGIPGKFAAMGMQIAAGVPLMVDNGTNAISDEFRTFRFGLFGLDKLTNIELAVGRVNDALAGVKAKQAEATAGYSGRIVT